MRSLRRRFELLAAIGVVFDEVDLLLTPTTATTAFVAEGPPPLEIGGQKVGGMGSVPYTAPFNISGMPAVSIPVGLASDGLPVGLQAVGRRDAEELVLGCGAVAGSQPAVDEVRAARVFLSRRPAPEIRPRQARDTLPGMTDTQPRARPPRQEQEPASEEVTEVAPGVLRMQLPIWMPGLGHVNMYGLVDDRGIAVVDPGLPGPAVVEGVEATAEDGGLPGQGRAHRRRHALASRPLRRRRPHRARGRREVDHPPRVLDLDGEGSHAAAGALRRRGAPGRDGGGRVRADRRRPARRAAHDQRPRRRARRHRRDRGDVEPVGREHAVGHDQPGPAAQAPADDQGAAAAVHAARTDRPRAPR